MNPRRTRFGRLFTAVLLTGSLFAAGLSAPSVSLAVPNEPSRAGLDAARAKLEELNHNVEVLAEEFNAAQIKVDEANASLEDAQARIDRYGAAEDQANEELAQHTTAAYQGGTTSELAVLLSATDFNEFSERLEYLNRITASDADLAAKAEIAGQQAQWAADDFAAARKEAQEASAELADKKAEVEKAMEEQQALVAQLQEQYKDEMAAARKAAAEAAAARAAAATDPTTGLGGEENYNPPPSSSAASFAVQVALDQVGDEYQWGAAGPDEFDCSGLVVYSYGKAGISLPHYSGSLYSSLPKVSRDQLLPGDLVFFYNPISHVGIYIGGGNMVHAYSEGSPVSVDAVFSSYYGSEYVGASRPG